MTYLHIHDQGLPKRAVGERRTDRATAESVEDALRARGWHAAAQAMAHQQVDLAIALRVLAARACQRRRMEAVSGSFDRPAMLPRQTDAADFFAVPA